MDRGVREHVHLCPSAIASLQSGALTVCAGWSLSQGGKAGLCTAGIVSMHGIGR